MRHNPTLIIESEDVDSMTTNLVKAAATALGAYFTAWNSSRNYTVRAFLTLASTPYEQGYASVLLALLASSLQFATRLA